MNDQVVTLQCWDTAGQEQYFSLNTVFYKGANCCVLVYDITDLASFASLAQWRDRFLSNASTLQAGIIPFVVVGNKCDLGGKRKVSLWSHSQVSKEKGASWGKEQNIPFFEASAVLGELDSLFDTVAETALANYQGAK